MGSSVLQVVTKYRDSMLKVHFSSYNDVINRACCRNCACYIVLDCQSNKARLEAELMSDDI